MMDSEDLIVKAMTLKPYTCHVRNTEIPCVVCPDEEKCEVHKDLVEFISDNKRMKVIRCVNSSIIYYKIKFNDDIEIFLYSRLWLALRKGKAPVGFIDPEEGYDAGILIMADHISGEKKSTVKTYLATFDKKVKESLMQGKMSINKFIRKARDGFFRQ